MLALDFEGGWVMLLDEATGEVGWGGVPAHGLPVSRVDRLLGNFRKPSQSVPLEYWTHDTVGTHEQAAFMGSVFQVRETSRSQADEPIFFLEILFRQDVF